MVPDWLRERATHVEHTPAVGGSTAKWPTWLPDACRSAIESSGIPAAWAHQVELANALFEGHHAAICTPTASGKTLGYLMAVMAATHSPEGVVGVPVTSTRAQLVTRRPHTALYLAPTKALSHDQERACRELGPGDWKVATLDGDSDQAERRFARDFATYVLTNPDMLHHAVLPNHDRWAALLGTLRYVVVDEAHRYSGVFGAHVAQVLRRLRRLCHAYGADPTFVWSSATTADAADCAARLFGVADVRVIAQDSSPHSAHDLVLARPEESLWTDASDLLARLVDEGRQTICFVPSRAMAEVVAMRAAERSESGGRIATYRSGYLAVERRQLEADLQSGELRGVAATNALELGIDVSGMDAVVMCGFPGTMAAFWQQAGRAGRGSRPALVTLLAREDPLDAYLLDHPELIVSAPVEHQILHPDNPFVMAPHLAAAAQEIGLTADDERWFGASMASVADQLVTQGVLRRRPRGWFWPHATRAVDSIDLRSIGGRPVDIVDEATGSVLGQVDAGAADRTVHDGAVYLHQGQSWLVRSFEPEHSHALATRTDLDYYTQPVEASEVRIVEELAGRTLHQATITLGSVDLSTQVIGYLRRDALTSDVWDQTPLDLPVRTLRTQSVWLEIPDSLIAPLELNDVRLAACAHAAEHCAIGLLGLFAKCDRWDIGGLSTPHHPDTGSCTIFVHDALPGGSGFAERGFTDAEPWLTATLNRLESCPCDAGCPACVISPKCGNGNQALDKFGAARLLRAVLG